MFSTPEFIEASRQFVCVRLESYESKEHQELVRSFLGGRFANTAFCILAPDGQERLTGSSRGPEMVLGSSGRGPRAIPGSSEEVIKRMNELAQNYRPSGADSDAVLQDFHSFRQALNVASGDQRLLLFVAAPAAERARVEKTLKPVFSDADIVGRFHLDLGDPRVDSEWDQVIKKTSGKAGFQIVRADPFGQEGELMAQLPLSTSSESLKAALLSANAQFSSSEERKVYAEHVQTGRQQRIYFEGGVPYGEDRDGDGEIDQAGGRGGPKGGAGRSRP